MHEADPDSLQGEKIPFQQNSPERKRDKNMKLKMPFLTEHRVHCSTLEIWTPSIVGRFEALSSDFI